MRLFFNYLRDFIREDFNLKYYLSIGLFLTVAISINYYTDLEDGIIDPIPGYFQRSVAFFLLYAGLYVSVLMINRLYHKGDSFIKRRGFWIALISGMILLSVDVAFQPSRILPNLPGEIRFYISKILSNVISIVTVLIPLWIFYKIIDRDQPSFYGLTKKGFIAKPYLKLFSVILPLVIIGSFLPGFQQQYPMYISNHAFEYWQIPEWVTIAMYELVYGWNFISIELLFRGFLVIGLIKYLGRHAIIPMAVVYCSIHFGKPMGECISSIFGGYILGVIAYYSRNIWGGVVIHVGLAWLMEIVSALNKMLF